MGVSGDGGILCTFICTECTQILFCGLGVAKGQGGEPDFISGQALLSVLIVYLDPQLLLGEAANTTGRCGGGVYTIRAVSYTHLTLPTICSV